MTGSSPEVRHAGLVVGRLGGLWRGGLIVGPSGSGKSTLALKLICQGWTLVSDDRTCLFQSSGRVFGVAPRPLVGLIEARGVAVARMRKCVRRRSATPAEVRPRVARPWPKFLCQNWHLTRLTRRLRRNLASPFASHGNAIFDRRIKQRI